VPRRVSPSRIGCGWDPLVAGRTIVDGRIRAVRRLWGLGGHAFLRKLSKSHGIAPAVPLGRASALIDTIYYTL
jgi:hypothetical protein